jgi:hypothetical protein
MSGVSRASNPVTRMSLFRRKPADSSFFYSASVAGVLCVFA